MKIASVDQLTDLLPLIGKQNVDGCTRAFNDGVHVWVFTSEAEVKEDKELDEREKEYCIRRIASGEKWAGIIRRPAPQPAYEPGLGYSPDHDPHGNRIKPRR